MGGLFVIRTNVIYQVNACISSKNETKWTYSFWVIFLWKKYLLVGALGMLWTGQWMSEWVSEWEMYVCDTNQIGSTIHSQSNFLLLRLMVCEKIWSRRSLERPYLFFYKRGGSIHILGLLRHFLWVRLTILVTNEMSLEVWNSSWVSSMKMQFN